MYEKIPNPFYREAEDAGNPYRTAYLEGFRTLIEKRRREAEPVRRAFGRSIRDDREAAREAYCRMLGWPLGEKAAAPASCREIPVYEDEEKSVVRLVLEVLPGLPFYGILFRHKTEEPLPLVISKHGGGGTPELCSSFFDCVNYNDMTLRLFRHGVNVFAPQTLLWESPRFGPQTERGEVDNALKQLGSSVTAVEVFSISRCLDWFSEKDFTDGRFGMAGLSYGGFYTLYTVAAEPRIAACLDVGHFNDRIRYDWPDMVWFGSALRFLDAEVGALICPRYLRIEVGRGDPLFDASAAEKEYRVLEDYYAEAPDKLEFRIFDGEHEFCPEEEGLDRLIEELVKAPSSKGEGRRSE